MKKKFFAKTVLLTIGVVLILAVSVFGIVSLLMPVAMMDFTASLGLKEISGDYAYKEYERSGSLDHLARSFIISADLKKDRAAADRFTVLYRAEGFSEFCTGQDEKLELHEGLEGYTYRGYLCGVAARVGFRLAGKDGEKRTEVLTFAFGETGEDFPKGNPVVALSVEAANAGDVSFCEELMAQLSSGGYTQNSDYQNIMKLLEGVINE